MIMLSEYLCLLRSEPGSSIMAWSQSFCLSCWLRQLLYTFRFSCYIVRVGNIRSWLYVDGASITYDRWTVRLRRGPSGAPSERQYAVGGRQRTGRNGQTCFPVSLTGTRCSILDLNEHSGWLITWLLTVTRYTSWSIKMCTFYFYRPNNYGKGEPISIILWLSHSQMNCR